MNKKIFILLILTLLKNTIIADSEILSLVCVKPIITQPGENSNVLALESLSNTLKDLNKGKLEQAGSDFEDIKSDLDEYLDPKIFRTEYGTDLKNRYDLRRYYDLFIEKIDMRIANTKDIKIKQQFKELRNLRICSYQALTRGKYPLFETDNKISFGIEVAAEASVQLLNKKPSLYGKTLELLQFTGGYGNFYRELPIACAGFQLIEFLNLCLLLNNEVKNAINDPGKSMINAFKRSCSLINATSDPDWQQQKFEYSIDELGNESKEESTLKSLGGIPQKTFTDIRKDLDNFKFRLTDNLKITAKTIYLNAAWSAGVMPVLVPILKDGGLMIGVISAPNDNDSSTDITGKLYSEKTIQSKDVVKAFFECFKTSPMDITYANNGFSPYVILKKKMGRLFLHYFLDPEINDFVLGFNTREDATSENIVSKSNFPGLQEFNTKYNKENNNLVERVYIWHCCWHAPVTIDIIRQATDEALKLKSLLTFFQKSNIYLKPHDSFDEFKNKALALFAIEETKDITK
ncbi:MAG: hypothetical protein US49_C0006G0045 [candidate division TM6 bacterium GW2011_GWF2_37_49]|nr:MAG: hypothetical protein US49_C0006G0045 [candidate division TM6 bacterium GW2011_GWF2_37_49]